jgi:hypothetical protein
VLRFLEVHADALQELRLVEAQPQRLRTGCARAPAVRAAYAQRLLHRMRRVLGTHLHARQTLEIEPRRLQGGSGAHGHIRDDAFTHGGSWK